MEQTTILATRENTWGGGGGQFCSFWYLSMIKAINNYLTSCKSLYTCYEPGSGLRALTWATSFHPLNSRHGRSLTGEHAEAERDCVVCLRSHSSEIAHPESEPRNPEWTPFIIHLSLCPLCWTHRTHCCPVTMDQVTHLMGPCHFVGEEELYVDRWMLFPACWHC